MGDSYEKIQDRAEVEFKLLRASVIMDYELSFNYFLCWSLGPAYVSGDASQNVWIHALLPKGQNETGLKPSAQWLGVLNRLRTGIDQAHVKNKADTAALGKRIDGRLDKMQGDIAMINGQLAELVKAVRVKAAAKGDVQGFGFEV